MRKLVVVFIFLGLAGCSDNSKPNIEVFTGMMESPGIKTQEGVPGAPQNMGMRLPPEGTVPVGFVPYAYKQNPLEAEAKLVNPIAADESFLAVGKLKFETYCAVCHGPTGLGDGTVASKMLLPPPSLVSDKVKSFRDGRIFHIISDGQGLMGSYANQIPNHKDRWAVVNFVRSLQKTAK